MNSRYETIRTLYEARKKDGTYYRPIDIARALGISKQLVYHYLKKFPEYNTLKEERKNEKYK